MPDEEYTIQPGDSVDSLCFSRGLFPEAVWDHPKNAELKKLRKDPSVLRAGDVLFLPELKKKDESAPTEQLHRYRRKAIPAKIAFQLLDEQGRARANIPYILTIDGVLHNGQTDGEGRVEFFVPPDAREAVMEVPDTGERFDLGVGHMDPIDTDEGVALRLTNLGFAVQLTDAGPEPDSLRAAVLKFQARNGLDETGEVDDKTRNKLKEIAGY